MNQFLEILAYGVPITILLLLNIGQMILSDSTHREWCRITDAALQLLNQNAADIVTIRNAAEEEISKLKAELAACEAEQSEYAEWHPCLDDNCPFCNHEE